MKVLNRAFVFSFIIQLSIGAYATENEFCARIFQNQNQVNSTRSKAFRTRVKLSGFFTPGKGVQIRDDVQRITHMIEDVLTKLFPQLPMPELFFLTIDPKSKPTGASADTPVYKAPETDDKTFEQYKGVFYHELGHWILGFIMAQKNPEYQRELKEKNEQTENIKYARRKQSFQNAFNQISKETTLAQLFITKINEINSKKTGDNFLIEIKVNGLSLGDYLNSLTNQNLISEINQDINSESSTSILTDFIKNQELRKQISQKWVDHYDQIYQSTQKPFKTSTPIDDRNSFYSIALHEFFADLLAVLHSQDPKVISNIAHTELRDFSSPMTIKQGKEAFEDIEFEGSERKPPHAYFPHGRKYIWLEYFSKIPQDKWPDAINAVADFITEDFYNNPPDVMAEESKGFLGFLFAKNPKPAPTTITPNKPVTRTSEEHKRMRDWKAFDYEKASERLKNRIDEALTPFLPK